MGPSSASDFSTIVSAVGDLFGGTVKGNQKINSTQETLATREGETRSRLELDEEAISKIILDTLGSAQGLGSIFMQEQGSGLYNSTVSANAAGDLVSRLVGEIAKLTAEEVSTINQTDRQETTGEQRIQSKQKDKGVLGGIGDFFGF
jgi:hypothetical protein